MFDNIIDFLVILVFGYIARMLWVFAKKKRIPEVKLLLKTISLFIILHLIIFPIVYASLINRDTGSIDIKKDIVSYERSLKLEEANKIVREIDSTSNGKKQKIIINKILRRNQSALKKVKWENFDNKRIVFLDSFLIKGYTRYRQIPRDIVHKVITVFNPNGEAILEFKTYSQANILSNIFNDHLNEIDSEKDEIKKIIKKIKANKFWNYRQILPYTLNILFTDNFNPQSRTANVIYFIHNILVVGFLLTFIMNLFQFYLTNNKNE